MILVREKSSGCPNSRVWLGLREPPHLIQIPIFVTQTSRQCSEVQYWHQKLFLVESVIICNESKNGDPSGVTRWMREMKIAMHENHKRVSSRLRAGRHIRRREAKLTPRKTISNWKISEVKVMNRVNRKEANTSRGGQGVITL